MGVKEVEQTLVIIKPEAFRDKKVAKILQIFLRSPLILVKLGIVQVSQSLVCDHYQEHIGKPYFSNLQSQLAGRNVLVLILRGANAVKRVRDMIGPYKLEERKQGTIRYRFMNEDSPYHENFVHGSDSVESANREIEIWKKFLIQ